MEMFRFELKIKILMEIFPHEWKPFELSEWKPFYLNGIGGIDCVV